MLLLLLSRHKRFITITITITISNSLTTLIYITFFTVISVTTTELANGVFVQVWGLTIDQVSANVASLFLQHAAEVSVYALRDDCPESHCGFCEMIVQIAIVGSVR